MISTTYDLAIIGGGINGCGVARDAAGRGMSVFLAEKGDLASGTSSSSTKLIHGGLRYLEHYEFRLVRESLIEREVLLRSAPHIISPLRFVLPHNSEQRPVWLIRLGLFLYDHLGGRKLLPSSNYIDLRGDAAGVPLQGKYTQGFEYSDCRVDDSRLVILNALDAAERGADIRVRTEVLSAQRENGVWRIETTDTVSGARQTIEARMLVNAAGPWVADVIGKRIETKTEPKVRLVKGSHVVVPGLFGHDRAYIFQNADQRVIFAIPYERDFTLIGTTDVDFDGNLDKVAASSDEIAYLCAAASEYFTVPIKPDDVVWSYSGVRPLFDDGGGTAQETTRDYVLDLQGKRGEPPLVNIFGGKITTYRPLAEEVLEKLRPYGDVPPQKWTAESFLPGGDIAVGGLEAFIMDLAAVHPDIDKLVIARLGRSYGTRANDVLAGVAGTDDLGHHFGAGLYQREVEYLFAKEWAKDADDILWRRGKLGLRLTETEIDALKDWMTDHHPLRGHSVA